MAVELAVGYVSLVPSADGFTQQLRRELSRPLDDLGDDLGKRLSVGIADGLDGRQAGRRFESEFTNAADIDAADIIDIDDFDRLGDKAGGELGDGLDAGLDDAGRSAPSSFSASFIPGIGTVAALAGGVLAAGLMQAFSAGLEQTRATARLAGQLGLTPEESRRIAEVASDVYTDAWGDSVSEVNAAIRSIDQNLSDVTKMSQKDLKRVTTSALALADVFEVDVNEATRAAGQLVRSGLAKDFDEAFDLIAWGFQNGMDRSGDFLDTLNEYAEPLASVGLTGKSAIGSLNAALQAGAFNLDKAGDAWKEFSIRAVDGSKLTNQAYEMLGLNADEMATAIAQGGPAAEQATSRIITALGSMTDPVAREQAGVALFGSTWEDLGPQVIAALDPANAKILETDGTMQVLMDTQDTAATKWESWKRTVQQAFVDYMANTVIPFIDEKILPGLKRIQAAFEEDGLGGAVKELQALWDEHWPQIEAGIQDAVQGIVNWLTDNADDLAIEAAKVGAKMGREMGRAFVGALIGALADAPIIGDAMGTAESVGDFIFGDDDLFERTAAQAKKRGRASGGRVRAGQPYIVGELRPELFVPDQSGYVYPSVPNSGNTFQLTTVTAKSERTVQQEFQLMQLLAGFN